MKDDRYKNPSYWIILAFGAVIFAIRRWGNELAAKNLLFPVVVVLFVCAFGFVTYHVGKTWKHPDEEILDIEYSDQNDTPSKPAKKQPSYEDRKKYFFSCIAFIAFVLFQQDQLSPPPLIFGGIVLTIACVYFLPALIQKLRGKEGEPIFPKSKLQPEHFIFMLFGLFGVGFCVFFCFIVITKLPLRIAIPCLFPPLIIGSAFARPLVAGLRILFRKPGDPGEKHVRKKKEQDPWDRPDREV